MVTCLPVEKYLPLAVKIEMGTELILQALAKADNKTKAAKLLNISYDSFRYQLKKFGLEQETAH